ncbi:MAG: hypothetical protein IT458_07590 [Planctomycetes bacterium]|nr:hypothetical protein [Planctomycetota bacterium]
MGFFKWLRGKGAKGAEQAVLVHIDGVGLPDHVYEECDLATLEDRLAEALSGQRLGDVDGNEMRETTSVVFMYGPDAERMFASVEPVLRAYPLCQGARVEIRRGPPGSACREVRI